MGRLCQRPFAGPEAVLAYFSRYTHRVAISNSRFLNLDGNNVTIRRRDNRARGQVPGASWIKSMTLPVEEFIRRFLTHVLSSGFHRIRHYGLLANGSRKANLAQIRELLLQTGDAARQSPDADDKPEPMQPTFYCRHCGAPMIILMTFARGQPIRAPPQQPRAS